MEPDYHPMKSKNRLGTNLYSAKFDHSRGQCFLRHRGIRLSTRGSQVYWG